MANDTVFVRGMRIDASVGIDPSERLARQVIEVDVDADVDTREIVASNDLSKGVDFTVVVDLVKQTVSSGHFDLIETLADEIARRLLQHTAAATVNVELRKFAPCGTAAHCFGVRIRRRRE